MGQGPATEIQNEIEAAGGSDQGDRSEVGNTEGTGSGEVSGFVPVSLMGQGPATNIQNEIVGDEPSEFVGDGAIEAVEGGEQEGGEAGRQEDVGGDDDAPAPLGEEGCVVAPRVREPLSKRQRRRRGRERARRREMARKEFESRRGVIRESTRCFDGRDARQR